MIDLDQSLEIAKGFKEKIGKDFVLGQTRYMCRWGTLSDGHGHLGIFRYPQALKEAYSIAQGIISNKAEMMKAEADLLDAESAKRKAWTKSSKLRAEANLMMAKNRIVSLKVTLGEQATMLDEYLSVAAELKPEWESRFPGGIEQAEAEHWETYGKYLLEKRKHGYAQDVTHLPLDPIAKAKLGLKYSAPELKLFLKHEDESFFDKTPIDQYLTAHDLHQKQIVKD